MKVLQVIDILNVGGAEKLLVTLANIQNQKKDFVSVLAILKPGPLSILLNSKIKMYVLGRKWKFNPLTMFRFAKIAKNYDIIHVHSSHNLRYVYLSSKLFFLKSKIVFHEHYGNIHIDKTVKWNQRLIYPQVEFIGVSKELCNWALNSCKLPLKSTHFVPNIIQYQPFYGIPILGSKKLSFLATCNIRRTKNIEFLINLFYKINTNNQHKLTIIGQPYDEIYYEELKLKISLLNLNDSIEFVHDCKDIQPILKNYDLALHSALSESGPLVLIEYLSQGLPFLTYRTGDIPEMLQADFSDFILEDFDYIKWQSAYEIVLSMNRIEVSKRMRNYYELNFSEESYYLKCKKIYAQALGY